MSRCPDQKFVTDKFLSRGRNSYPRSKLDTSFYLCHHNLQENEEMSNNKKLAIYLALLVCTMVGGAWYQASQGWTHKFVQATTVEREAPCQEVFKSTRLVTCADYYSHGRYEGTFLVYR